MKSLFFMVLVACLLSTGTAHASFSIDINSACKVIARQEACKMDSNEITASIDQYIKNNSSLRALTIGQLKGCLMMQRPLMIDKVTKGDRSVCDKWAIQSDVYVIKKDMHSGIN